MKIPTIRTREPDAYKGNFGRVVIVGGSRGMSGAVALTGMGALHAGAGLVTLAVPDRCLETVAGFHPCYMTVPIANCERGCMLPAGKAVIDDLLTNATSAAIGPGLRQTDGVRQLVADVYANASCPLVVDADALNALAAQKVDLSSTNGPRILTPHIGEFRRLAGDANMDAEACREQAVQMAGANNLTILLKGHRTLITDGTQTHENQTGNPGMATGGSGDVLTGIIVALLGQGYTPMEAAVLGAHVHGLAGDLAREVVGEISLTARHLIDWLSAAFLQLP